MVLLLIACVHNPQSGPPARAVAQPLGPAVEYPVAWGDSLWQIAWRTGTHRDVDGIAEDNGLYNPDWILAGERLKLYGVTNADLSPWPAYEPVPDGLKACDARVSEAQHLSSSMPASCPLTVVEAQLDQDRELERLIGCKIDDNDYAMSTWSVVLVDGPRESGAFELADFGEGSVVEGPMGCELLATRWEAVPTGMSTSWHLTGRRMRLADGELVFASDELRSRRLLYSFEVSTPDEDLSDRDAMVRNVEPSIQGERIRRQQMPWGVTGFDELGDARTGLLYPKGYAPSKTPASVTVDQIRTGAWEQVTVVWM